MSRRFLRAGRGLRVRKVVEGTDGGMGRADTDEDGLGAAVEDSEGTGTCGAEEEGDEVSSVASVGTDTTRSMRSWWGCGARG